MVRAGIFHNSKTKGERCVITGKFVRFFVFDGYRWGIVEADDGKLWISPARTVRILEEETGKEGGTEARS